MLYIMALGLQSIFLLFSLVSSHFCGSHVSSSITDFRELGFIFESDSAIHEYITLSEQLERVSYLLCGMC